MTNSCVSMAASGAGSNTPWGGGGAIGAADAGAAGATGGGSACVNAAGGGSAGGGSAGATCANAVVSNETVNMAQTIGAKRDEVMASIAAYQFSQRSRLAGLGFAVLSSENVYSAPSRSMATASRFSRNAVGSTLLSLLVSSRR